MEIISELCALDDVIYDAQRVSWEMKLNTNTNILNNKKIY